MKNRIFSFLLAISLLASLSAAGCGETGTGDATAGETSTEPAAETSPDNIPLGTDLGGQTVRIYVRGDTIDTEFAAEQTGDIVDDAIYNRNRAIEDRLNVTLDYFSNTSLNFWDDRNIYMDTVRASVLANDGSVDIAAGLSNIMPYLAQDGLFINLLRDDIPYLDFDSPWWPAELTSELSVENRMYMTSGEACLGVIKGMMCFYFNKDMIEQNKLENPYELVTSGKWTLDKFNEMASAAYNDINGDTKVDDEDIFGFIIANENHAPNFVLASGYRLTEPDSQGLPKYALGSDKIVTLLDKLVNMMDQDGFAAKLDGNDAYSTTFINGKALFTTGEFQNAETFRDLGFDFGILPYPKLDDSQSDYITSSRATYSLLGITVTASDIDAAAAVLEASASENYRSVTPVYFEKALKVKYSRDDVSSQMFDIIKSHISFDFGVVHGPMMENISTELRQEICRAKGTWSSTWAAKESTVNTMVSDYLEAILALEN